MLRRVFLPVSMIFWATVALAGNVVDATGRSVKVPEQITRGLPAGQPAAVLLAALTLGGDLTHFGHRGGAAFAGSCQVATRTMTRNSSKCFLLALCLVLTPLASRAQELTVFAAASLTDAMKDVSAQWALADHPPLRLSFGSSSTLARQIEEGAPANMFASADLKWMDYLADKKLVVLETRKDLLSNDVVLVVPADKPKHVIIGQGFDILDLLGPNGRIATGDPKHVPIGIYAEQALRKLGLWDAVEPRLARTEDVRAALLLVEYGEAPAGIVYATEAAVSKGVMIAGTFPANSHDAVTYPFAVVKSGDTPDARALMTYLSSMQAHEIFAKRGFKVE